MDIEAIKNLINGIKAVRALIDDSDGVSGLHLNGEIASWNELLSGGEFEDWLIDFNIAEECIEVVEPYLPAETEVKKCKKN